MVVQKWVLLVDCWADSESTFSVLFWNLAIIHSTEVMCIPVLVLCLLELLQELILCLFRYRSWKVHLYEIIFFPVMHSKIISSRWMGEVLWFLWPNFWPVEIENFIRIYVIYLLTSSAAVKEGMVMLSALLFMGGKGSLTHSLIFYSCWMKTQLALMRRSQHWCFTDAKYDCIKLY